MVRVGFYNYSKKIRFFVKKYVGIMYCFINFHNKKYKFFGIRNDFRILNGVFEI